MKYILENQPEKPHEIQHYFWLSGLTVNAGEKMHRRAGKKNALRRVASCNAAFPVRLISLLSHPDLGTDGRGAQRRGWEDQSHAQHREHGEHRTFPAVSTVGRLTASRVSLRLALALLALFEAIAVAVHFEDVDVVCQPIEQCAG
jgi:hypothetical protein